MINAPMPYIRNYRGEFLFAGGGEKYVENNRQAICRGAEKTGNK